MNVLVVFKPRRQQIDDKTIVRKIKNTLWKLPISKSIYLGRNYDLNNRLRGGFVNKIL